MEVHDAMVKDCFDSGILRLVYRMRVDPALLFFVMTPLYEFDWYDIGLHDLFLYKYTTEKMSRVWSSAPMVCKLADGTEKKVSGTESIRPIYRQEVASHDMSFVFAKAAWLHYLIKKLNWWEVPSLGAQDTLLQKRASLCGVSFAWVSSPHAAHAVVDDAENDSDWDLGAVIGLEKVERVSGKRHVFDFWDSCRDKKRKVLETAADAFEFATEFVNQKPPVDTSTLSKLVFVKDDFATAQVAANEAKKVFFIAEETRHVGKQSARKFW